jgi:VCBS repeat-containing protein
MKIRKKSNLRITAFATLMLALGFVLLAPHSLFAQCPDVGYWKLDEDAIDTYYDAINGNNGTRGNRVAPASAVDFKIGAAKTFDGATTGIDIPADASGTGPFDWAGAADFTIEFWLKRTGTFSDNEVLIGRSDGNVQWWIGLWGPGGDAGKVMLVLQDSNSNSATPMVGSTSLNDDTWHHVAIVRDESNDQILLYVDGVEDTGAAVDTSAVTFDGNFASMTKAVNIGYVDDFAPGGAAFYSGALDELAIHNSALTNTQISTHFTDVDTSGTGYCGTLDPQIVSTAKTSGTAGFRYLYNVNATGETLPNYTLTTNPDPGNMSIDTTTGVIEWTPSVGGSFNVIAQADNGSGTPDTQDFAIAVDAVASCDGSLVAYWKLDEDVIGTYVDSIGGYHGSRGTKAPTQAADAMVDGAQSFDGATTGIDIPADAGGSGPFDWAGAADFTIEFWLKRTGTFTDNEVLIGRSDGNVQWWVGLWGPGGDAGKVMLVLRDSNSNSITPMVGSTSLNDDTWHHVAIVRDESADQILLYVDGVEDTGAAVDTSSITFDGNFSSMTKAVNIGYVDEFSPGGAAFYSGSLDELALFNTALDAATIDQHFDNGNDFGQGYCTLNSAPTAVADSGTVDEGGTLNVNAANGVLDNDSDPESQTMTAILVADVTNGSLTLNADGSYTYTHDGSETTSDSFTYKANDGTSDSNTVAVTITVNPQNDVPQISNGGASIPTTVNAGEQYTYDFDVTDPDGPSATWSLVNNPTGMAIDANGVVTWTPPDGTTSSGDVTVIVSDGTGQDSETFTITVGGGSSSSGGGGGGGGCFINSLN